MKEMWMTEKAPQPSGKIAQVSRDDNLGIAFISGLISQDVSGRVINGTVTEQTRIILKNLEQIVADMGLTLNHVIKTNVYLTDIHDFDEMNTVYNEYFSDENPPARQCVEAGVWGNLAVEISAVVVYR